MAVPFPEIARLLVALAFQVPSPVEVAPLRKRDVPAGINALAWSRDGQQLAVAGNEPLIRVFDSSGTSEQEAFRGMPFDATAAEYSPDGSRFAAAGSDGVLRVWETSSRRVIREGSFGEPAEALSWLPDGAGVALAAFGEFIWDVAGNRKSSEWKAGPKRRKSVDVDAAGKALAFAGPGTPPSWRVLPGGEVHECRGVDAPTWMAVAFSPDGKRICGAGSTGSVALWDRGRAAEPAARTEMGVLMQVLAWHPGGDFIAVAGKGRSVHLLTVPELRRVALLQGHSGGEWRALAFTAGGELLAGGGSERSVHFWDTGAAFRARLPR